MILGQNFKFLLSLSMVKSDLEMMFADGVECVQGLFDHLWRFQIWLAAILDFLQRGNPSILGQNFNFKGSYCMAKRTLEMMFGGYLEWWDCNICHIWYFGSFPAFSSMSPELSRKGLIYFSYHTNFENQ